MSKCRIFELFETRWLLLTLWVREIVRIFLCMLLSLIFFIGPLVFLGIEKGNVALYHTEFAMGTIVFFISSLLLTSIAKNRQLLKEAALRDSLTGLYRNREFFRDEIYRLANNAKRSNEKTTLIFADLDNFREFNTKFSHAGGDYILKSVASSFLGTMRDKDLLGRFAGDEFIMVINTQHDDEINLFINRINKKIEETPIFIEGKKIVVTVTFGLETVDCDTDIDSLFRVASEKMLAAKKKTT